MRIACACRSTVCPLPGALADRATSGVRCWSRGRRNVANLGASADGARAVGKSIRPSWDGSRSRAIDYPPPGMSARRDRNRR